MHIPDAMLQGSLCPVTATVSALGIAAAAYFAMRGDKPSASRFAAITALIFAGQMMNFPIMNGTSGHLLGGVLAATLLGTPLGVLAIALVVTIQSLVFSDGGITVLGANLLNMALIGAGLGGMIRSFLAARWQGDRGGAMATAIAAWASVVLASFAVSVELAIDGQIAFSTVVATMVGTHGLIGLGEAAITGVACLLISATDARASQRFQVAVPLIAATLIALLLSPFASGFPDGLEWVAGKYAFLHESAPAFVGPFPGYAVSAVSNEGLSTGLSGLIGVAVSFVVAWGMLRLMTSFAKPQQA